MPDQPEFVSYSDVVRAEGRIRGGILETPCNLSDSLSRMTGVNLFCKSEYLQRTGSFKERGARNALLCLPEEVRRLGVIAASAGNHALALAYHGLTLGVPVTVVMPTFAPLIKQSRCLEYGARVLLSGNNIREAKVLADELVLSENLTYIHGFDGHDVIAGAGTLGLEILRQVSSLDAVLVPVGGGGLLAGLGVAIKSTHPHIRIIGVETENAASFSSAMAAGHPTLTSIHSTLADGLAVPEVGPHAFEMARRLVDEVVLVDEESVAVSILRILEMEKGVVEGAGATCLAALFAGKLNHLQGMNVVACLCGGNIDPMVLGRVVEHALTLDGRLAQFSAVISDRPGGLAKFCELVASTGASIKQIVHERAFASADVSTVEVECTVETRDRKHIESLMETLRAAEIQCSCRPTKL